MRAVLALLAGLLLACGTESGGGGGASPKGGTVTFGPEEGVDFATGKVQDPGTFANSDLYATNSSTIQLASGGPNSTKNRPVTWFITGGNVPETFKSLDDVPEQKPLPEEHQSLPNAQAGVGFVVQTKQGGYARGWIEAVEVKSASDKTVTIQYELF